MILKFLQRVKTTHVKVGNIGLILNIWTQNRCFNGVCGLQLRVTSKEVLMNYICNTCSNTTLLKLPPHIPGASEFNDTKDISQNTYPNLEMSEWNSFGVICFSHWRHGWVTHDTPVQIKHWPHLRERVQVWTIFGNRGRIVSPDRTDRVVGSLNTLNPRRNCHHFSDNIFKCIF